MNSKLQYHLTGSSNKFTHVKCQSGNSPVWYDRLSQLTFFIYLYVTRVQSICKSYLDISTLYSDLKSGDRRHLRHNNIKLNLMLS